MRDRQRVIARIEAAGPTSGGADDERLARLEAEGVLRRSRRPLDPTALRERILTEADVVAAIVEERGKGR